MRVKLGLAGTAFGLAVAFAAPTAGAAPVAGLDAIKGEAQAASPVDKIYWTWSCSYHRGYRHCGRRWVEPLYFGPRFYFHSGPRYRHYGHRHYGRRR